MQLLAPESVIRGLCHRVAQRGTQCQQNEFSFSRSNRGTMIAPSACDIGRQSGYTTLAKLQYLSTSTGQPSCNVRLDEKLDIFQSIS
jgi:hypothetical protein